MDFDENSVGDSYEAELRALENWFHSHPQEFAVVLGARCSLSAFGDQLLHHHTSESHQMLWVSRVLLLLAVASFRQSPAISKVADELLEIPNLYPSGFAIPLSAVSSKPNLSRLAGWIISSPGLYESFERDVKFLENEIPPGVLVAKPLLQVNDSLRRRWFQSKKLSSNNLEDFAFWIDWYERLLDGRPQNWNLLEEVALLPASDWEKGSVYVNSVIERIQRRYDLEAEIEKLKDALVKSETFYRLHPHRLDNNPPEAIEDSDFMQKEVARIWENLAELDEEIEKPEPSVDVLKKIAASLFRAATSLASYCATLADVALKKAAQEVGGSGTKWAIRSSVAYYAAQTEGAKSVGSAIIAFAKTLGG